MEWNRIIAGVVTNDRDSINILENFFRSVLLSVLDERSDVDYSLSSDLFNEIVYLILKDNRGILTKARSTDQINTSYIRQWIRWNIQDLLNNYTIKPIQNALDDIISSICVDNESDTSENEEIAYFYVLKENIVKTDDILAAKDFCNEFKSFISSQNKTDIQVICAYMGYVDIPADMTRTNFDVKIHRIKKKIKERFKNLTDILRFIDKGLLKDCDIEDLCKNCLS